MKTGFYLIAIALVLITKSYAGSDPEHTKAASESGDGTAVNATARNGESILLSEHATPKVVGILPPGWQVVSLEGATIESDPLTIRPGLTSVITVNPYRLVPDPKQSPYALKEPGFDPSLGNHQTNTIGAILSNYLREEQKLDDDLGTAIDQLRTKLTQTATSPDDTRRQPSAKAQPAALRQPKKE